MGPPGALQSVCSAVCRPFLNQEKIFQRGTKKRDLSDKSETGEDPKKVREGSLDCSQISETSDIPDDIFTKSLNSPDWVAILFNCLKNLESKMKEISVSSKETTASPIKGEKQLSDLIDSKQLISGKFDEYKKDRKAKKWTNNETSDASQGINL